MFNIKNEEIILIFCSTLDIQIKLDDYKIVHYIQDINEKEVNKI